MGDPTRNGTPPTPQVIQPGPCPATVITRPVKVAGRDYVLLEVRSPTGVAMYFLDPANADAIAAGMTKCAATARSGLVLPDGP